MKAAGHTIDAMSQYRALEGKGDKISNGIGMLAARRDPGNKNFSPKAWIDRQLEACKTSTCSIDLLTPADSPRIAGELDEHVRLLAQSLTPLPPIIVHKPSMRVIDGMHRLAAAKARGDKEIEVCWFEGDERDAFAIAVQTNVFHGLPLSLDDRRAAAARIIESHPEWSDRMVASIVNLAPSTVGAIRARSTVQETPSNTRVGSDGRIRPVTTVEGRRRAGELLRENPDAPLREVARSAGLAPSTVLDVRNRILEGLDPVPQGQRRRHSAAHRPRHQEVAAKAESVHRGDYNTALRNTMKDPSLRYSEAGRMLLRLLQPGLTEAGARSKLVGQLPSHCLDVIATLARRQAAAWNEFASELENRSVQLTGRPDDLWVGLSQGMRRQ
jgi:hypothetical protein